MKNIYEVYEFYKNKAVQSVYFNNKKLANDFLRLAKKSNQHKNSDFGLQTYKPNTPEYNDLLEYLQEKNIQIYNK